MLPSAKNYLIEGGYSPEVAAYILIGCFLGGVIGIQIVSRVLHHYIPSHIVDCDHSHEAQDEAESDTESGHSHDYQNGHAHSYSPRGNDSNEITPLLSENGGKTNGPRRPRSATVETTQRPDAPFVTDLASRRPSLQTRFTRRVSIFISEAKALCDEGDPCYGYSDPCGKECMKAISRSPTRAFHKEANRSASRPPRMRRASTHPLSQTLEPPLEIPGEDPTEISRTPDTGRHDHSDSDADRGRQDLPGSFQFPQSKRSAPHDDLESGSRQRGVSSGSAANSPNDPSQAHHHHVPSNAFLSIGLQTSIAIALHKLPEGFITYATNHANPKLGFAVFVALFIHNITEGFAMALPLYLALGSRWKAVLWSSLLGGFSQPLGAGVAALWFKLAKHTDMAPGERVYGGMFAVTAGIMASVALQLFSESLGLTHNRNLCIAFAFIGMGILGVSFALTAG
ncbi:hypothetical protein MMC13_006851 [Lambiella insularis]|nr:hypothetical protein [Lambiella insularis]